MPQLFNYRVAVIALDGFEESELTEPVKALRDAGAHVDILSLKRGTIQAFKHHDKTIQVAVDHSLDEVHPGEYNALLLPGGALNTDASRIVPQVQGFLRSFQEDEKPFAAICHAPWLLISSGLVTGRKLTSYKTIQDDVQNAGGIWSDQEVVVDGNWVTSRQPSDLPAFNREMLRLFSSAQGKSSQAA